MPARHLERSFLSPTLWGRLLLAWTVLWTFSCQGRASEEMLARLHDRVAAEPESGSAWRLLGKQLLAGRDFAGAFEALGKAIELTPDSAAAWSDFAQAAAAIGENQVAIEAYDMVLLLAPDTDYAADAELKLPELRKAAETNPFRTASFEVRRFDGEEVLNELEDTDPPRRRWLPEAVKIRVESGLLYNSNVALAPVSRQLAPGERESFQAYTAPKIEWAAFDEPDWRSGPTFRGRFTANEDQFRRFNLQSYRPGWFVERYVFRGEQLFVPRVSYDFTHDEFDLNTLGNRHGLTTSLSAFWNDDHASFLYWATDYTDFQNDGVLPEVTSQDGWLTSIGISHDVVMHESYFSLVRAGVDVSQADTDGSDYRYRGINVFVEGVVPIVESWELTLDGGWGYRDFYDFEFQPSRNEVLWRAGAELRKYISPDFSVAAVCDFSAFDSENPLFAADRTIAGLVAEYEY